MMAISFPESLVSAVRGAKKVAVMTGAGISAESGIPTFREAQTGLWSRFRPEELATPEAFRRDPKRVWEWYQWRRSLIANARPNPGHLALATMANHWQKLTVITQNIDGFHQLAGSRNVLELHGNIHRTKCFENHHFAEKLDLTSDAIPPRCQQCQSPLRPDVVWFGEMLPQKELSAAAEAVGACDLFFSIGTSSVVYPAADLVFAAIRRGVATIEINPAETPASSSFSFSLRGAAGEMLPSLLQAAWPQ